VIDKDYTAGTGRRRDRGPTCSSSSPASITVSLNFGKPDETRLRRMTVPEARGHLEAGSSPTAAMGPKVRAGLDFVDRSGREVMITSAPKLASAVQGRAGTRIVPEGKNKATRVRKPRSRS